MAVIIPDDVEDFCTEGERHFYGFLKNAAKPDSKYLAWYLPSIEGRSRGNSMMNRIVGGEQNKDPIVEEVRKQRILMASSALFLPYLRGAD